MIKTSDKWKETIIRDDRKCLGYITLDNTDISDELFSYEIEQSAYDNDIIGTFCKDKIKINVLDKNKKFEFANKLVGIYAGLKYEDSEEYIFLNTFVISKAVYDDVNYQYELEGSDISTLMEIPFKEDMTYPCTRRQYIEHYCNKCGIKLQEEAFNLENKMLNSAPFVNEGGTYKDAIRQIAQSCMSNCKIIQDTLYIISTLQKNNIKFNVDDYFELSTEKEIGPYNILVLGRSPQEDNIYYPEALPNNPLEYRIDNNVIVDANRKQYISEMYNYINGLKILPCTIQLLKGRPEISPMDYFTFDDMDEVNRQSIVFTHKLVFDGDFTSEISCSSKSETETNYKRGDSIQVRLSNTEIIVDKQKEQIKLLNEKIVDLSTTETGKGKVPFENATIGALNKIIITGKVEMFYPVVDEYGGMTVKSGVYKSGMIKSSTYKSRSLSKYPSNDLFPTNTYLVIKQEDKEDIKYKLPIDKLNVVGNVSDEFIWEYNKMKIVRRVAMASNGEYYILTDPYEEDLGELEIIIPEGDGEFIFESFPFTDILITYMLKNEYTETFSTKVELKSSIEVLNDEINLEVTQKFFEYDEELTGRELISRINLTGGTALIQASKLATITADKIDLSGKTIALTSDNITIKSTNFNVDKNGNLQCNNATMNNATVTGGLIKLYSTLNTPRLTIGYDSSSGKGATLSPNVLNFEDDAGWSDFGNNGWTSVHGRTPRVYISDAGGNTLSAHSSNIDITASDLQRMIFLMVPSGGGEPYIEVDNRSTGVFSSMSPNGVWSPSFNQNSLESKKKNIVFDDGCLDLICNTDIVTFNWKYEDDTDKKHVGLIIPDEGGKYSTPDKVLTHDKDSIDLYSMVAMGWKAIQELNKKVEDLKNGVK